MISLASELFCYPGLAAMFKLAEFGASGVIDSQASMRVSSALPLRLSRVTFVGEKPGDDEREWPVGSEGGVLPELKMASVSASPRNFTSGFWSCGSRRVGLSAFLRSWRKAERRR
uniref:Uncharacterized protein n=1 Tax=Ursus americanus TaxID=9643 RepID=A0A452QGZ1_URSAM